MVANDLKKRLWFYTSYEQFWGRLDIFRDVVEQNFTSHLLGRPAGAVGLVDFSGHGRVGGLHRVSLGGSIDFFPAGIRQ